MMKPLLFFILFTSSYFCSHAQRLNNAPNQGFIFITNTDSFFNATIQHTKPYFLYFTASWCQPCRQLQSITFNDSAVINYVNKNAVALKIDVDKDKVYRQKYYVSEFPTVIVFDKNGNIKMRFEGIFTAESFLEVLKSMEK